MTVKGIQFSDSDETIYFDKYVTKTYTCSLSQNKDFYIKLDMPTPPNKYSFNDVYVKLTIQGITYSTKITFIDNKDTSPFMYRYSAITDFTPAGPGYTVIPTINISLTTAILTFREHSSANYQLSPTIDIKYDQENFPITISVNEGNFIFGTTPNTGEKTLTNGISNFNNCQMFLDKPLYPNNGDMWISTV